MKLSLIKIIILLIPSLLFCQFTPANKQELQVAINEWKNDNANALNVYGSIAQWDVRNITDMSGLFSSYPTFNDNINSWDVSNVTTMRAMFSDAQLFNQPLNDWNVSNVTDMGDMFFIALNFNQDISNWDVSSVTNTEFMFYEAQSFNQNISGWNTSSITNMQGMFNDAETFNQNIGGWDVSNVTNMDSMFQDADSFNQDISGWDVSNVTTMIAMFLDNNSSIDAVHSDNVFNQNLNNWNVSNVTNMKMMFYGAVNFNQPLNSWSVVSVTDMTNMFHQAGLSTKNYDDILIAWSQQIVKNNVTLGASGINYCNGEDARQILIDSYGWTITDNGLDCSSLGNENPKILLDGDVHILRKGSLIIKGENGLCYRIKIINSEISLEVTNCN
jgi:surface protein